ncbi:MAG: 50S ribosomal protein L18Ae [Methanotrichaceae archaeon]
MRKFEIQETFKVGNAWQSFSKVLESQNEKNVVDKAYSLTGSEQGLKRNPCKINEVKCLD